MSWIYYLKIKIKVVKFKQLAITVERRKNRTVTSIISM